MKLHVVRSEVIEAAENLKRALDNFTDATNDARQAAEHLSSNWEGERQKDFVREDGQECQQLHQGPQKG